MRNILIMGGTHQQVKWQIPKNWIVGGGGRQRKWKPKNVIFCVSRHILDNRRVESIVAKKINSSAKVCIYIVRFYLSKQKDQKKKKNKL